MKYIKDKDLDFLGDLESKDLDNLVKILIKPLTQELTKREMYKEFYPEDKNVYKLNNGKFAGKFTIVSGKIGVVASKLANLLKPESNIFRNVDEYLRLL